LFGSQVAAGGAPAWQTPPIAPPQQNQPQPFRVDAPVMQPIGQAPPQGQLRVDAPTIQPMGQPAPAAPQRGILSRGLGVLFGGAGGGQPQQSAMPGAPTPPTIRSNPLTFALGGQNALNSMFQNQLAQQQQGLAARRDERDQQLFGMQQTQFDWSNQDRQRQADRRRLAEEYIASRPAEEQLRLRAIDPDELGDYIATQQQNEISQRRFDEQMEIERERLRIDAANAGRGGMRPMTPQQITGARSDFATARTLRESYDNFINMIENADTNTLLGIGPSGAEFAAAQSLLALQAKSPAALDLGALVGADFEILDNIIGNPNAWQTLIRQGGREGAIARLRPFGGFMAQAERRLRDTYMPYADDPRLADFYSEPPGLPNQEEAVAASAGRYPTSVPPEAAERLRRNPTQQERALFDEAFGPGAAERALRARALGQSWRSVSDGTR
jgi:hypothetical protein